jgi:hypothetical protein
MNRKPYYPLKDIKNLVREGAVRINIDVQSDAWDDFGFKPSDIKKCILKLNDREHSKNREKNHFWKTEPYKRFPETMMDYYKANNIMTGINVYTHFYIHPNSGELIISSFKEL